LAKQAWKKTNKIDAVGVFNLEEMAIYIDDVPIKLEDQLKQFDGEEIKFSVSISEIVVGD